MVLASLLSEIIPVLLIRKHPKKKRGKRAFGFGLFGSCPPNKPKPNLNKLAILSFSYLSYYTSESPSTYKPIHIDSASSRESSAASRKQSHPHFSMRAEGALRPERASVCVQVYVKKKNGIFFSIIGNLIFYFQYLSSCIRISVCLQQVVKLKRFFVAHTVVELRERGGTQGDGWYPSANG